MYVLCVTIIIV